MRKVYLVGAGPGDPELITLRGLKLIKKADVIIYDRLAGEELLKYARDGAELVYVGKRAGKHSYTQEEINGLLVEKAGEGKIVVRLKGGDPFVFGRGGEEAAALRQAGIGFEVVPGVTSAIAVPAAANIPVTDRRYASSFAVVTGQEDPGKKDKMDYGALGADTIVVLMGVGNLKNIITQMLRRRSKDTPVAIIEHGTTERQRVITCTLSDAVEKAAEAKVKPPAVVVIGEVVNLREALSGSE
jgi:uroporphyrin-III C-methyltransferase